MQDEGEVERMGRGRKGKGGGGRRKRMMPQQLEFNISESRRRAESGMDQALGSNAGATWAERAERWLAERGEPFTSEAIVAMIGLPAGEVGVNRNNAVGALIRKWSQRGSIARVGYAPSTRVESHGALLSIWLPARLAPGGKVA